jgi:hypothetical protein
LIQSPAISITLIGEEEKPLVHPDLSGHNQLQNVVESATEETTWPGGFFSPAV